MRNFVKKHLKKYYSFVYIFVLILPCIFLLTACQGGNENPKQPNDTETICTHSWKFDQVIHSITCTQNGEYSYKCELCGECKVVIETAKGHVESNWIIDDEPTCSKKGVKHKECVNCHQVIVEEDIAQKEHSFVNNECTVCGERKASEGLAFQANGEEYIVYLGTCTDSTVVIPSFYNNKPVTRIGDNAFYYNQTIESVKFMDNSQIVEIGKNAFQGCGKLKNVEYPTSLKTIKSSAFFNCSLLESATFNEGLEEIGVIAFKGTAVSVIYIPSTLMTIGIQAFRECTNTEKIYWNPKSVATAISTGYSFSDGYFSGSKKDQQVIFGKNVESIPSYLFCNVNLRTIVIPSSFKYAGSYAFNNLFGTMIFEDTTYSWQLYKQGGSTGMNIKDPGSAADSYNRLNDHELKRIDKE